MIVSLIWTMTKPISIAKPIILFIFTSVTTVLFLLLSQPKPPAPKPTTMARSFILFLHGLGGSGPAKEHMKNLFTSAEFRHTKWSFPSAPPKPVTYYGAVMRSWFDILEVPVTADSAKNENGVLQAVKNVHAMIDNEIADGINPNNVFVCGFSQGAALALASVLLYPKTLGGCAIFNGWVPFNSSILDQVSPEARRTPFLWAHGLDDRTVLLEAGQAGPPFLAKAGVSCEFKAYPGLGHSVNNEELRDLESWIRARLQSSS